MVKYDFFRIYWSLSAGRKGLFDMQTFLFIYCYFQTTYARNTTGARVVDAISISKLTYRLVLAAREIGDVGKPFESDSLRYRRKTFLSALR